MPRQSIRNVFVLNVLIITTSLLLVGCGGVSKEDVQAIMASESSTEPSLITEQYSCLTDGKYAIEKGKMKLSFKGAIVTKFSDGSMHVDVSYVADVGELSVILSCQMFNASAVLKKYNIATCLKGSMISAFDQKMNKFTFGFSEDVEGSYVSYLKETVTYCSVEKYN